MWAKDETADEIRVTEHRIGKGGAKRKKRSQVHPGVFEETKQVKHKERVSEAKRMQKYVVKEERRERERPQSEYKMSRGMRHAL